MGQPIIKDVSFPKAKQELLGQFARGFFHEFNNQLAISLGYAEMGQITSKPDVISNGLKQIQNANLRSKRLIEIYSAFLNSAADSGSTDLKQLFAEFEEFCRKDFKDENIQLSLGDLPEEQESVPFAHNALLYALLSIAKSFLDLLSELEDMSGIWQFTLSYDQASESFGIQLKFDREESLGKQLAEKLSQKNLWNNVSFSDLERLTIQIEGGN